MLSAVVTAGWLAGAAQNGIVTGRVVQPPAAARSEGRPAVGAPSTFAHEAVDRRTAVVYLEAAPRPAFDPLPRQRARMDQRREHFVPRVLAVTIGTTVDFPNNDQPFHNVMSLAPGNTFDLGRYPRGQSRSVRFDTPGIVPVICDIHAHMSAWVLVFNHPYFAVTDALGRYTLADVPPGEHTLRVWSELGRAQPRRIVVAAGGRLEADLPVEPHR